VKSYLKNLKSQLRSAGLNRDAKIVEGLIKMASDPDERSFEEMYEQKKRENDAAALEEEIIYTHEEPSFEMGGGTTSVIGSIMTELNGIGPDTAVEVTLADYIRYLEGQNQMAKFDIPKEHLTEKITINVREAVEKVEERVKEDEEASLSWMLPEYDPRIHD